MMRTLLLFLLAVLAISGITLAVLAHCGNRAVYRVPTQYVGDCDNIFGFSKTENIDVYWNDGTSKLLTTTG